LYEYVDKEVMYEKAFGEILNTNCPKSSLDIPVMLTPHSGHTDPPFRLKVHRMRLA